MIPSLNVLLRMIPDEDKQQGKRTDLDTARRDATDKPTLDSDSPRSQTTQDTFTDQSSLCSDEDDIDHKDKHIHDDESSSTAWPLLRPLEMLYAWIASLLWCLWPKLTSPTSHAQSRPLNSKSATIDDKINEWMKDPNIWKKVELRVQATMAEIQRQDEERAERDRAREERVQRKMEANRQASLERRRKRREEARKEFEESEREWEEFKAELERQVKQRPKPWDLREPSDAVAYIKDCGASEEDCRAMENNILYELGEGGVAGGGGGSVCDFLIQMEDEAVMERQRIHQIHRNKLQECMKELTARTTEVTPPQDDAQEHE